MTFQSQKESTRPFITLPIFPTLEDKDITDVINALNKVINRYIISAENI